MSHNFNNGLGLERWLAPGSPRRAAAVSPAPRSQVRPAGERTRSLELGAAARRTGLL